MKWKIWPRQYGKTHDLRAWWMEDPANRVILCLSEAVARNSRHYLLPLLADAYPGNTLTENRRLTKYRIMSYRTWLNGSYLDCRDCEVAVDDLEAIMPKLFKGNVVYGSGSGQNDIPDPEHANYVDDITREYREKYGAGWDA